MKCYLSSNLLQKETKKPIYNSDLKKETDSEVRPKISPLLTYWVSGPSIKRNKVHINMVIIQNGQVPLQRYFFKW